MIPLKKETDHPLARLSPSPVLLAPMVGLSHVAVRKALQEMLPVGARALWPTEMLSSRRLPSQKFAQVPEVDLSDAEHGLCPQLLGNEQSFIEASVNRLQEWGAVAIDINMGCPVKRALKHNYGVALMGDVDYAARVTALTVRAARVPVSVKLRAGLQKDFSFLRNFAKALETAGASWLTLHPRLAEEGRRGHADWTQVARLKAELQIPLVGNGDLQTLEDIQRSLAETGCDRVMIGRALLAKPWLLAEAWRWLQGEAPSEVVTNSQLQALSYRDFLLSVLRHMKPTYTPDQQLRKFKFLIYHSHVWTEFGHQLYRAVLNVAEPEQLAEIVHQFFDRPRTCFDRTNLRH